LIPRRLKPAKQHRPEERVFFNYATFYANNQVFRQKLRDSPNSRYSPKKQKLFAEFLSEVKKEGYFSIMASAAQTSQQAPHSEHAS
jgi:hypothetical protein